jgi:hypothetical protein
MIGVQSCCEIEFVRWVREMGVMIGVQSCCEMHSRDTNWYHELLGCDDWCASML